MGETGTYKWNYRMVQTPVENGMVVCQKNETHKKQKKKMKHWITIAASNSGMHPKDLREESQELFTQPCPQKQDSQKPEKLETTQASTTMGKQLHKVGTVHRLTHHGSKTPGKNYICT
jgi:hypothetical protein